MRTKLLAVLWALISLLSLAAAQDGAKEAAKRPATDPAPVATPTTAPDTAPDAAHPQWLTDLDAAKATAKKEDKLIVATFVGSDWCGYSIKERAEVFSRPAFTKWAAENAVLLLVDFPNDKPQSPEQRRQNRELAQIYGVRGYPTTLLLKADGKQIGLLRYAPGGVRHWLQRAEAQIAASQPKPPAERSDWITDYDKALALAKEHDKPLLVNFTGSDWCPFCIRLEQEVFAKPEFVAWAKQHVVLVTLDFPRRKKLPEAEAERNEKLQEQFGVEGFPTVVFVGPDGKELSRTGYEPGGPEPWIAAAERELGLRKRNGDKKAK